MIRRLITGVAAATLLATSVSGAVAQEVADEVVTDEVAVVDVAEGASAEPEPAAEPVVEETPAEPEFVAEPAVEEAPVVEHALAEPELTPKPEPTSEAQAEESAVDPEPVPAAGEIEASAEESVTSQVIEIRGDVTVTQAICVDGEPAAADGGPNVVSVNTPEAFGVAFIHSDLVVGTTISVIAFLWDDSWVWPAKGLPEPWIFDSANNEYYQEFYLVDPCEAEEPDPEPTQVTPEAPSRDGNAVTIPSQDGVEYRDGEGDVLDAGEVVVPEEGLQIVAVPVEGYVFPDEADDSWYFEYMPSVTDPEPIEVDTDEPRFDGEPVVDYENPVMPVPLEEEYYTFTPGRLDYGDDQRGVVAVTYEAEPKEGVVFIEGAQTEFTVEFPWVNFPTPDPDPQPDPVYVEWSSVINPLAGVPACSDYQLPEVEGVRYFAKSSSIDLETGILGVTVVAWLVDDNRFFVDEDGNVLEVRKRVFYEEFDQSECGWWAPLPPTDEEEDEGTDKEKPNGDSGKTPVVIIEVVNDGGTDKNETANRQKVVVDSREDDDKPATSQRQLAQTGSAGTAMLAVTALAAIIVGSIITARRRRSQ